MHSTITSDSYLDRSAWLKHSELLLVGHKIPPALPFYFVWSSGLVTYTNFELVHIGLIWLINFYIVCMSSVGVRLSLWIPYLETVLFVCMSVFLQRRRRNDGEDGEYGEGNEVRL